MGVNDVGSTAKQAAQQAEQSTALDRAVRVGLGSFGVVHLLLAWLMLQLALGSQSTEVNTSGALRELAAQPFGRVLLAVLGAGFVALVLWQVLEAFIGHRSEGRAWRVVKRVISLGRAVVYGALAVSALKIALRAGSGGGEGEAQADTVSAQLMGMPFGGILVAALGVAVIGFAVGTVYWALSGRFEQNLERKGVTGSRGQAISAFAKIGYSARAAGFLLIGLLFIWAAVTRDSERSGGMDEALSRLLSEPFGPIALGVMAVGFACFGLYCFAWARHLARHPRN